ncbi:hypothetical protein CGCSCA4_v009352 [Colletotrichum siamense]|uniref:Uncharacterized protein n=1 Tax=Colletotrichum siamense TaxID=690259 RepID=A0A9P5ENH6_COLSI|nr:hypothetical protein CGCSCA4_v009352 [Colletotrichum siamense]KAF4855558.1 hypothetical protein CGCSCA2_v009095 [Colletotrichum siamense]
MERNADDSSSSTRLTSQGSTVPKINGRREYRGAGEHPFNECWNDCRNDPADVRSQILGALQGFRWNSYGVSRVGPSDGKPEDFTTYVSITAEADTFDWEQADVVVLKCQKILDQYGFSDVCCELSETVPMELEKYRKWVLKNRGRYYYHGLPSIPTLLARSPDPTWNPPIDNYEPGFYSPSPVDKYLSPLGRHPITEKWNNDDGSTSLRSHVLQNLKGVNWTSVDILRCGHQNEEDLPAILFVSVEPGSTTPEEAQQLADRCAATLINHGLTDVSCEVKESHVVPLSKLQPPATVVDTNQLWKASYNLTDLVGATIAGSDQQENQGTKGPYLRVKTVENGIETSSICALTSLHVLSSSVQGPKHSAPNKIWQGCEAVVQPGIDYKTVLKSLAARQAHKVKYHWDDPAADEEMLTSYNARTTIESRTFGHLTYARQGSNGRATDWALIRLDADKHERSLDTIQNQVPIGPGVDNGYNHGYDDSEKYGSVSFFFPPEDGIHTLRGILPVANIQEPGSEDPTREGAICFGKVGHGSGLTFGLANQALSILRRPIASTKDGGDLGEEDDSIHLSLAVLGKSEVHGVRPFTRSFGTAGDSGACAWDLDGRVAGMVTAGSTWDLEDRCTNVTYVTPMEWILEDMRECGLEATLCE